mmetsp:Transcript_81124/g.143499  ORF Transcript_81124/g.143499 Transcript_81124/m.143499 type:complete len:344 (+) Transcript_81124:77-1108(+)
MAVSVIDESGLTAVDSFSGDASATDGLCSLCESALGWPNMNPGQHCRFCRSSVCTKCSSSSVYLEGHSRPQRACDMCVKIIPRAHWLKHRLTAIVSDHKGGSKSPGLRVVSEIFKQKELSLTKQGNACMLSNVLFVMAASVARDAGSAIPDALFNDGKSMCRFQEALNCGICTKALGWHKMSPRHHCRFCGISVCASCSASTVYLQGQKMLRACNTCANIIPAAHEVKDRLTHIARNLCAVGGSFSRGEPLEVIDEGLKATHTDIAQSEITNFDKISDDANIAKEIEAIKLEHAEAFIKKGQESMEDMVPVATLAEQAQKEAEQEDDAMIDAVTFSADMFDVF